MLRVISILVLIVVLSSRIGRSRGDRSKSKVPCYFVFGDSLSDCGNNNRLLSKAKANYKPYGIDFPGGIPTGRFTNGKNYVDVLSELLGFDSYIPAFYANTTSPSVARRGVNYASGAGGILPQTGSHLGERMCFGSQIESHISNIDRVTSARRGIKRATKNKMKKCLYTINIGSNDYINNYFMDGYGSANTYTPLQFATLLIDQERRYIKTLYDHGARKVALFGLGEIGCSLAEIHRYGKKGSRCVPKVNNAVHLFNDKLVSLVDELNRSLPDAKFIYINSTANRLTPDEGFKVFKESCCSMFREDGQCVEGSAPCNNRREYIFFDPYHPTEAVHAQLAQMAFRASNSNQAYPTDISHLIMTS